MPSTVHRQNHAQMIQLPASDAEYPASDGNSRAPSTVQVRNLALGVVARGVDWKKLGFVGTTDSESPEHESLTKRTCDQRLDIVDPARKL